MENMKIKLSNNLGEVSKLKERHIVSWSQEEDEILREQIRIHGTDNWTNIASKFKDKSTRQCRRRWYTYLNSDFKKGGWSPEEDLLLCEAQKIYGNRWTEIAKVVSGRTDNAVKNRFTTLCKKRAKHEAFAKENNASLINLNNKRVIFRNRVLETAAPMKKMRTHISQNSENRYFGEFIGQSGRINNSLRPPFAELPQNFQHEDTNLPIQNGMFLKKDDPRILALVQQSELLSSLALKVNSESSDQSLENAWKVLQNYLSQSKESDTQEFKNPLEDSRSSNVSSPDSSEYSTGSTQAEQYEVTHHESIKEGTLCENSDTGFNSPIKVTPLFRSLAASIPSPKFSESEKHFLLKTLGLESKSPNSSANHSQSPQCKRVLLYSL